MPGGFAVVVEEFQACIKIFGRYNDRHADTAVKGSMHLMQVNIALLLQPVKDGWWLPGADRNLGLSSFRHDAGQVFQQATTGDVGQGMDINLVEQLKQRFDIESSRCQQGFSQRAVAKGVIQFGAADFDDLADQLITI